jgi:hypothetical protein
LLSQCAANVPTASGLLRKFLHFGGVKCQFSVIVLVARPRSLVRRLLLG